MNTYARVRHGRLNAVTEEVGKRVKNGQEKAPSGQNSAPKWPQRRGKQEKANPLTQVESGDYDEVLQVEAAGVEPASAPTISKANSDGYKESTELGAALSTAPAQKKQEIADSPDPDLQSMIAAWPTLPQEVKKRILSLLPSGTDKAGEGE
ncbi:MAG: hypothetical protein ABIH23_32350 [bacterium]